MSIVVVVFIAVFVILLARLVWVIQDIRKQRKNGVGKRRAKFPIKTVAVLGSGGHTTEMLQLLKHVPSKAYDPLFYVIASTDETSERRVNAFGGRLPTEIYRIPRSREVGQSYLTSIFTTLWAFGSSFVLVLRTRPDLVLCNGPGTCLPIAVCTFLLRIVGLCEGNLVFVESFCRVER